MDNDIAKRLIRGVARQKLGSRLAILGEQELGALDRRAAFDSVLPVSRRLRHSEDGRECTYPACLS